MARTTTSLNPTQVKKAKPKDKGYSLVDGRRLLLRIEPNGVKKWVFNYPKPFTKKRSNLTVGSYQLNS